MRFVQGCILELTNILRSNDRVTRRHQLVERSHAILHMRSLQILFHSCSKVSVRHKPPRDIPFSRSWVIRSAIHSSRREPPTSCPSTQATRFGGCDTTSGPYLGYHHCQEIYQQKMERSNQGRKEDFKTKYLRSLSALAPIFGLSFSYHRRLRAVKIMNREIYPYIDCGKPSSSCFLCATFIQCFTPDRVTFRTRGKHRKAYTRWSIPDVDGLEDDMA